MKLGRNAPCPCGSGKKYKKCCYLSPQQLPAEKSLATLEESTDKFLEMRETLMKAMINLRKYKLDKKPHIKEYYKARKLHSEIVDAMAAYHDSGKFVQQIDQRSDSTPLSSKEPVLYLFESEFDMNTDLGLKSFYDMLIYKLAPNTNCITEEFLQKHRYRKAEKIEMLQSMLASKPCLFEVVGIDSDEGYVSIKEVFTGVEHKIADMGMSNNPDDADFYLYTRIIKYRGISFSAGPNFIFGESDDFILEYIRQEKKLPVPTSDIVRFVQLYNQYSKHPGKFQVITNTLG